MLIALYGTLSVLSVVVSSLDIGVLYNSLCHGVVHCVLFHAICCVILAVILMTLYLLPGCAVLPVISFAVEMYKPV